MYSFHTVFHNVRHHLSAKTETFLTAYNREKKLLPELIVKTGDTPGELFVYVRPRRFSYRSLPETRIRQHNDDWLIQTRINPVMLTLCVVAAIFLLLSLLFFSNTAIIIITAVYISFFVIPLFLAAWKQHRKMVLLVKAIQ